MKYTLPPPSEHNMRNAIIDMLRYEGYMVWTNNSGARKDTYEDKFGRKRERFTRFGGIIGASDIFAIRPSDGKFIAIEVKRNAKEKPSRWQEDFITQVNSHNGIGMVAWSTEQVQKQLGIKNLYG